MPIYEFKSEDGEIIERFFSFKEKPSSIKIDGKEYVAQIGTIIGCVVKKPKGFGGKPCSTWPRESAAMGVSETQVKDAMAEDRRKGVPTDYTKDGNPILTSPGHEKAYMKAHGFHHRGGAMGADKARKMKKATNE